VSRLPADYLPIDGNELFQSIGAMPPVLQVQIDIPHEYSYLFEKTYSTEAVAIKKRLKEMVLARYAQAARAALWTLRQQRNAGIIPVFTRNVWLIDGVAMRYSSLSGVEYVMLVIPAAAVLVLLQKIVEEEPVEGDLLVLYSGNKAALISAASLTSGNVKVRMKKTLLQSSWGSDRLRVCQLKLRAGKESVCLGSLKVTDNIITSTTKFNLFRSGATPKTMTQFVEVSRDTTQFPIFNGDGQAIYTAHDKFTVSATITRDESVSAYDDVSVEVVDVSGGRYTQQVTSDANLGLFGPELVGSALYNLTNAQATQYDAAYPGQWGIIYDWGWVGGGGAGDFEIKAAVAPFAEGTEYTFTLGIKFPVFVQVGGVDRVDVRDVPYTGHFRYGVSGTPGEYDRHWGEFRWMEIWDEDAFEGPRAAGGITPYPFPFNRGVAKGQAFGTTYTSLFTSYVTPNNKYIGIEHPYGTEPDVLIPTEFPSPDKDYLDGWLHLSNGEHVLQAFVLNKTDIRAYYDNKPVANKIAAALDIDASSIQAMILDVPVSRFKSFK
jgi:hypothetical protein